MKNWFFSKILIVSYTILVSRTHILYMFVALREWFKSKSIQNWKFSDDILIFEVFEHLRTIYVKKRKKKSKVTLKWFPLIVRPEMADKKFRPSWRYHFFSTFRKFHQNVFTMFRTEDTYNLTLIGRRIFVTTFFIYDLIL